MDIKDIMVKLRFSCNLMMEFQEEEEPWNFLPTESNVHRVGG